jgi:hypothetical protein
MFRIIAVEVLMKKRKKQRGEVTLYLLAFQAVGVLGIEVS